MKELKELLDDDKTHPAAKKIIQAIFLASNNPAWIQHWLYRIDSAVQESRDKQDALLRQLPRLKVENTAPKEKM